MVRLLSKLIYRTSVEAAVAESFSCIFTSEGVQALKRESGEAQDCQACRG